MMKQTLLLLCLLSALTASAQHLSPDSLIRRMSLDEKLNYLSGRWKPHDRGTHDLYGGGLKRLGIPTFKMEYAQQGVHTNGKSTLYPSALALAATFDTLLVRRVAQQIGKDCRARGIDATLAPELTLYHPDVDELQSITFGDQVPHTAQMIRSFTAGIVDNGMMPIARYSASEGVSVAAQRELFRRVVSANRFGGIAVRGIANGRYASENRDMNIDFLRGECNFKGILFSDCWQSHTALAVFEGGIDIDLPRGQWLNADTLRRHVAEGRITETEVDRRIGNTLSSVARFGLNDPKEADHTIPRNNPQSRQQSLDAARKAITLLKNEHNILPLKKSDQVVVLGNRLYTNSQSKGSYSVYPFVETTLGDALAQERTYTLLARPKEHIDLSHTEEFFTAADIHTPGLTVSYYNNPSYQGTPIKTDRDSAIDFNWGVHPPVKGTQAGSYSIRWEGVFVPTEDRIVRFALSGSGQCRLSIDGQVVCDNSGLTDPNQERSYMFRASAGQRYQLNVEFAVGAGDADIQLTYTQTPAKGLDKLLKQADKIVVSVGSNGAYDPDCDFWISLTNDYPRKTAVVMQCCDLRKMDWSDRAAAAIQAWHTGESAGQAIADVLSGKINPSGKMPVTTPNYPFGYGLNYKNNNTKK